MKRTITLTGRRPVKIDEDEWPEIACGSRKDWDGQYEFQSFRKWNDFIKVRQHDDGRAIVYGRSEYDTAWQNGNGYLLKAGELVDADGNIAFAIKKVAERLVELGAPDVEIRRVAAECLAGLPAEEI